MNQLDIGLTLLYCHYKISTDKRSRNYILPLDKTHNEIKPDEDKTMNINNNAIVQLPQEAHNVQSLSSSQEDVDSKPLFLSKPLIVWQYNLSTNHVHW
jgi:Cu2+-containing amine oxidase